MIHRLLAPNPGLMTGAGTNTYLVESGGAVAVVDPGPEDSGHVQAIVERAASLGTIQWLLVTHGHLDHLPGALLLRERSGAPIYGQRSLRGVDRALADGETLRLGPDAAVRALETPGHTDDSLCYWLEGPRALFTGDLVAGAGTVIVDDAPGGLAKYVASLERLLALGSLEIFPGHGPVVADGRAKLEEYLAHRRQREAQVLDVLAREGPCSVERIVAAIYVGLTPGLLPMAARNVRAHLDKLAAEGRARQTPQGWRPGSDAGA